MSTAGVAWKVSSAAIDQVFCDCFCSGSVVLSVGFGRPVERLLM